VPERKVKKGANAISTGNKGPRKLLADPPRKLPADPPCHSATPAPNGEETDPTLVTWPVLELVHQSLTTAWAMEPYRRMCIRFDVVNPLMQFKRGSERLTDDCNTPFPSYDPTPEEDPNVTEDDDQYVLEQYEPMLLLQCVLVIRPT